MLYIILMYISCFIFFANDLLLAVYFQTIEMMLDKKQIQAIFLLELKIGHKSAETTHTSTMHLAQEMLMNIQCSGGSQSFAKEDKSLQDEKCNGWPSESDSNQQRSIFKADPLTNTQEIAQEVNADYSMVIWHLKQIGNVKKFGKWVPYELTKNLKNCHFEVLSSLCNKESFIDWIMTCDLTKSGFYTITSNQPGQWLDREEAPKHFPKPNLHQKKVTVTIWWPVAGV